MLNILLKNCLNLAWLSTNVHNVKSSVEHLSLNRRFIQIRKLLILKDGAAFFLEMKIPQNLG